jgi:hypothetical protein
MKGNKYYEDELYEDDYYDEDYEEDYIEKPKTKVTKDETKPKQQPQKSQNTGKSHGASNSPNHIKQQTAKLTPSQHEIKTKPTEKKEDKTVQKNPSELNTFKYPQIEYDMYIF